jgi:thiamine-phosphate pyrophosphorylase
MKLCYVTDRKALPGRPEEQTSLLLEKIADAARAGVHWIQIREKDLEASPLLRLVEVAKLRAGPDCRILVNDRLDVALAAQAHGVHLGEQSLPLPDAKRFARERKAPTEFLFGISAHSLESVQKAEADGADYVIFGPIFSTPSKQAYGRPLGLAQLAAATRAVSLPVLAIGGITKENTGECIQAGAAGIAAIRLFQGDSASP